MKQLFFLGDFNIDLKLKPRNTFLTKLLIPNNFISNLSKEESTTYSHSQIDWIFSNCPKKISCGSYQTVFSYHKALYAIINEQTERINLSQSNQKLDETKKRLTIADISKKINEKFKEQSKTPKTNIKNNSDHNRNLESMTIDSGHNSSTNMDISMNSLDEIQITQIESMEATQTDYCTFNEDSGFEKSNIHSSTPEFQPFQNDTIHINSEPHMIKN